ncbi:MAG: hypothetical protein PF569_08130 [Candidatus Woesearchaeota archaeon]|jgi:hypothetical protein|nr:hypothetical protein [Candidatus Woesearchaeota archaeon]
MVQTQNYKNPNAMSYLNPVATPKQKPNLFDFSTIKPALQAQATQQPIQQPTTTQQPT